MRFGLIDSVLLRLSTRWPWLICAATWTIILTAMVAVASFVPEVAFVSLINPKSSFSEACRDQGASSMRVPLDDPNDIVCFPAQLLRRSQMDSLVPPVFAAIIVATCAYAVKAIGLWESDEDDEHHTSS